MPDLYAYVGTLPDPAPLDDSVYAFFLSRRCHRRGSLTRPVRQWGVSRALVDLERRKAYVQQGRTRRRSTSRLIPDLSVSMAACGAPFRSAVGRASAKPHARKGSILLRVRSLRSTLTRFLMGTILSR